MAQSVWFKRWGTPDNVTMRVYCFPHAGAGAAAIKTLSSVAPDWLDVVAVQFPGRENRFLEDIPQTIGQITDDLVDAITEEAITSGTPFLLMGQCSGAVFAYETGLKLDKVSQFRGLVVCSRPAPSIEIETFNLEIVDKEFIDKITAIGGVDPNIASEPALMELLVPALRRDFALVNGYSREPKQLLNQPILAVRGQDDETISIDQLQQWKNFTSNILTIVELQAGHFLFNEAPMQLLDGVESFVVSTQKTTL